MSDLQEIKHRLVNEDRIVELLESIGCEYVDSEQRGSLITAQLPERFYSTNKRSVQVRMSDSLPCKIRSRSDFKGDIFSLVSYLYHDKRDKDIQSDLFKAKEYICKLFGWNDFLANSNREVVVKDYTASLKAIIGNKRKRLEYKPNPILQEEVMNEFYFYGKPLPYISWQEEGIDYDTQVKYGVGFDLDSKRVVFPLRNRFGQLVGVKGRIMKDEDDPDRKYLYIYRCNNRYEWFNLHNALPDILTKKRVFIFEAEKSCMKAWSLGIENTLAIGASDISLEQAEIIKNLGLDIEIILCYDKGIGIDEIKVNAKHFMGRSVYAMYDVDNLLEHKDAPIDKGFEVWNNLVDNNIYEISFEED